MTVTTPLRPAPQATTSRLKNSVLLLGKLLIVGVPVALWAPGLAAGSGPASAADPVARFLVTTTVIILLCHVLGTLFARFGQAPATGELVGGLLLGPVALGWAWPAAEKWLLPAEVKTALNMTAQLGLVALMFLLGAELRRVERVRTSAKAVSGVVAGGLGVPFLAGCALALTVARGLHGTQSTSACVLFFGLALAITALPVLARVLMDMRLNKTPIGAFAMGTSAISDGVAWLALSAILAFSARGSGSLAGTLAVSASLISATLLLVRPALARMLRAAEHSTHLARLAPAILLVGAIGYAATTQMAGLDTAIGAFLFGTALPARSVVVDQLTESLQGFTLAILLPMFFVEVGLNLSLHSIGATAGGWTAVGVVVVAAIAAKLLGAGGSARLTGALGSRDALRYGVMMNCRGVTELVVAGIGYQQHLINAAGLTVLALVAVTTSIITPAALKALTPQTAPGALEALPPQAVPAAALTAAAAATAGAP